MLKDLNLLKLLSSQVVSFTNRKLSEDVILNNYKSVFNDY